MQKRIGFGLLLSASLGACRAGVNPGMTPKSLDRSDTRNMRNTDKGRNNPNVFGPAVNFDDGGPPADADSPVIDGVSTQLDLRNLCARPRGEHSWLGRAGVWLANVDSDAYDSREALVAKIAELKAMGITEIHAVVWNKGVLFFNAPEATAQLGESPFMNPRWRNRDILKEIITEAHRQGMKVSAWFESGLKIPAAMAIVRNKPEWFSKTAAGAVSRVESGVPLARLNPSKPEVRAFMSELVRKVAENYAVDAIQIDDHFAWGQDWGYEPETVARYRRETGKVAPRTAPVPNTNPNGDVAKAWQHWAQWKANFVTELAVDLNAAARANRSDIKFTASPNPYPWSLTVLSQDWPAWIRRGMLDELHVQIYRTNQVAYSAELRNSTMVAAKSCLPVFVGIYAGSKSAPTATSLMTWQINIARDFAFDGVTLFHAETALNAGTPEESAERRETLKRAIAGE